MLNRLRKFTGLASSITKLYLKNYRLALPTFYYTPKYQFSTSLQQEFEEILKKFEEDLKHKKCHGCGAKIQYLEQDSEGYVPRDKLFETYLHNLNLEFHKMNLMGEKMSLKAQAKLRDKVKGIRLKDNKKENILLDISDPSLLEELESSNMMSKSELYQKQKNAKPKHVICMRCHNLKHKSHFQENVAARVVSKNIWIFSNISSCLT